MKLVVGISGTIASGKGLVREILKQKGFHTITISDLIREELINNNMDINRKSFQDFGNSKRKEFGGQYWVEQALKKYNSYDIPLVIDGIRNMAEVDFLKENSNFVLIGVDAPFETRWQRVQKRNRDADLLNHDRFVIDDARDRGFNEPLTGQQVAMCLVHADYLINNDEEFLKVEDSKIYREVNNIYKELIKKK